jgi:hypothetical protein
MRGSSGGPAFTARSSADLIGPTSRLWALSRKAWGSLPNSRLPSQPIHSENNIFASGTSVAVIITSAT